MVSGAEVVLMTRPLTQTLLWSRGPELHQVLQVRLLRGNLKVTDVTVSLPRRQNVLNQQRFHAGTFIST